MNRRVLAALVSLAAALAACERRGSGEPASPAKVPAPVPSPPVTLRISYGSEKKTWLEEQVKAFSALAPQTSSGKPIRVELKAMGSGEAASAILSGSYKPHVYSPASGAYINLLNHQWLSVGGNTRPIAPTGDALVLSPIVIAIWKPMAEALGWPQKQLGWRDLLKVNANPAGWGAFGHPEWGRFKLGHTHPEYSNSGLLAVLAEAYAGAKKTRGLTVADLKQKATRSFVADVERTLVHYGKSTGFFGDKMLERGPSYISAAVLYESVVIESYAKKTSAPFPLVAIYPTEGTFWSDHPWSVLEADWVGADEREAASLLHAFLKAKPAQQRALELGFRPADPAVRIAAPIDAAHGADPLQPQTLLEVPGADVLQELLAVWAESKKPTDLVFVFDKSGSMHGRPLVEAKAGARAFLQQLGARDQTTLIFFDDKLHPPIGPVAMDSGREVLLKRIDSAIADGGTALYDAVERARSLALERAAKDPNRIYAVVVMTDGNDGNSTIVLDDLKAALSSRESPVRVFSIAYGSGADVRVLEQISESSGGAFAKGTTENIVQVYQDVAAYF